MLRGAFQVWKKWLTILLYRHNACEVFWLLLLCFTVAHPVSREL